MLRVLPGVCVKRRYIMSKPLATRALASSGLGGTGSPLVTCRLPSQLTISAVTFESHSVFACKPNRWLKATETKMEPVAAAAQDKNLVMQQLSRHSHALQL
jgi:hypothetical protein